MIRVLLVDDQAVVRAGFGVILAEQPDLEVVGEAGTGPEAVAAVRRTRPDVVCMDVRMPGGDGLAATRAIVAEHGDDAPRGRACCSRASPDGSSRSSRVGGAARPPRTCPSR